eukprot:CAMPEP_0194393026 /NCGR_PEP_ID=MMETSP0174-20130528/123064_1 /TAXON_ID=216777 /ORGANISM="Proboscia alata, Strain PI-D3" /LENGTH=498 /DNA_ID=CAMNT_0039188657 /DNA_START=2131 /DNA_END=3624 /DNA_ORIENTATION=-
MLVAYLIINSHSIYHLDASIEHDYTGVTSIYDFTAGGIDHWCLDGSDDSCICDDPTIPASRVEVKGWSKATNLIQKYVQSIVENELDVDVAFIGDGLIERLNGIVLGVYSEELETVMDMFHEKKETSNVAAAVLGIAGDGASNLLFRLKAFIGDGLIERLNGIVLGVYSEELETVMDMFKKKKNLSSVVAATLGIAGDGASNLLFRLKEKSVSFSHLMDKSINESMISSLSNSVDAPPDFNPKIWFIHIGIEDFMKGCSEEVVLVGILRVVEELMVIKKDAKIIISPINPIRESARRGSFSIAGDGASNLLFRLKGKSSSRQMGVPPGFNPKIWFIHIGIEDFMKGCSEEVVLVGILRVVEELMVIKKDAKIIISPINPIRESAYTIMPHFGNGKLGEERKQAIKDARKRFGKDTDELKAFKARIKEERKADKKGLTDRGVITPEGSTIPHIAGIFPKKMSKKDTEVIEHNFQRSIKEVNKQLEKFAAKHDNVFYSKT